MEYKSIEYNFKLENFIDKDNKYHLWIVSFALALQDLTIINNIIYNRLKKDKSRDAYFFKLNIGHLREAFNLIRNAFNNEEIKSHLEKIDGVKEMYEDIIAINDGESKDSFGKAVLFELRNNIFHYNDEDKDFSIIKDTIVEMCNSGFNTRIKLCNPNESDILNSDYIFAEEIQLNVMESIGLKYKNKLEINELTTKLTVLTAKVLNILEKIVMNFIMNTNPLKFNYITRTR